MISKNLASASAADCLGFSLSLSLSDGTLRAVFAENASDDAGEALTTSLDSSGSCSSCYSCRKAADKLHSCSLVQLLSCMCNISQNKQQMGWTGRHMYLHWLLVPQMSWNWCYCCC